MKEKTANIIQLIIIIMQLIAFVCQCYMLYDLKKIENNRRTTTDEIGKGILDKTGWIEIK